MSAHTAGPWEVAVLDAALDPVAQFREMLSYGSGPVWAVWVPQHPKTRGKHPRPEHAALASIVGNGPTSEANARLITAAPDLLAALEALCDEARHSGGCSDLPPRQCNCEVGPAIKTGLAAIAKARGES